MKNFFVVRITNNLDGTTSVTSDGFEDGSDANTSYFVNAGQAVASSNPTDTVFLLSVEGYIVQSAVFKHKTEE